jgi:mono/diheme cytochrome c family protein
MSWRRSGVGGAMRRHVRIATVSTVVALGCTIAVAADAHVVRANRGGSQLRPEGATVGHRAVPKVGPHTGSHGSTVVADVHGLLVAERNAGKLVRADRDGVARGELVLHEGVSQVVHDGAGLIFVADRLADRVVRVVAPDARSLEEVGEIAVGEPHGLALTPDGSTLLVTSVADHALVAVDTRTLEELWRAPLVAEPRGVAVSANGHEAVVGFLSSSALAVVVLSEAGKRIHWRALDPRDRVAIEDGENDWDEPTKVAVIREARGRFEVPIETGRRRARNAFSVAYLGHGLVVAPHQLSTPQMKRIPGRDLQDSYGGGPESVPAIVHRLALVDAPATDTFRTAFSRIDLHQPRALAYDSSRDTLYLGGYGDDRIAAVADVSQPSPYVAWTAELSKSQSAAGECGVDGLSVDGDSLWVHCELSRRLFRLQPDRLELDDKSWLREKDGVLAGPELAASLRDDQVERGAELFRRGRDGRISDMGVMACASCHPEGRQDGLSWRLGKSILQTPMLAGRVVGTAPYKWDGQDHDLATSFRHTVERLGGSQWSSLSRSEFTALAAYVQSLPAPRAPTVRDAEAVARGRSLFHDDLDCGACHSGDKLTDGSQYPFDSRGLDETDTPSLVGLAHTAPYYHDGSARDLYALLTDKGNVHDMTDLSDLDEDQITDLTAYLESL